MINLYDSIDIVEEKLIIQATKGDRSAVGKLYAQYKVLWFSICQRYNERRVDAEDCLQNSLVNIFTKLDQFDHKRGNFKNWSCGIVVNENLMYLRKKGPEFSTDEMERTGGFEMLDERESPLDPQHLLKMLQKLPKGYRTVFNLYVLEGYTHQEISDILKISVGASKSQLSKARKLLQSILEVAL